MPEEAKPLKLEGKKEELAAIPTFVWRVIRYTSFAAIFMGFSIGIGTIGYHYLGNLEYIDSFHMASMILTGMGPVAEMKTFNAKLFSSLYALYSGIAFLSMTAVFLTPILHRLLHILHVEKEGDE